MPEAAWWDFTLLLSRGCVGETSMGQINRSVVVIKPKRPFLSLYFGVPFNFRAMLSFREALVRLYTGCILRATPPLATRDSWICAARASRGSKRRSLRRRAPSVGESQPLLRCTFSCY